MKSLLILVCLLGVASPVCAKDAVNSVSRSAGGSNSVLKVSNKKNNDKQTWIDYYEKGECQANMKRRFDSHPAFARLIREYGAHVEKAFTPAVDLYCQCISTGMAEGSKITDVMNVCLPGMKQRLKLELYGMGYDVYN